MKRKIFGANEIEVTARDETVGIRMRDDNSEGYIYLDVEEAEEMISMLKEGIEEAKKSK